MSVAIDITATAYLRDGFLNHDLEMSSRYIPLNLEECIGSIDVSLEEVFGVPSTCKLF
jgi:hypothetical protein